MFTFVTRLSEAQTSLTSRGLGETLQNGGARGSFDKMDTRESNADSIK